MTDNERRKQERFSLQLQAKLIYESEEGTVKEETIAANISSGGAFLTIKRKLPLASRVEVEFFIELEDLRKLRFILSIDSLKTSSQSKIWVKATGIVIRCEEEGLGIIFERDYQLSPMQVPDL